MRLLAFVVIAGDSATDGSGVEAILAHAAASLPVHMQPASITPVPHIPATVNGKVDREALLWIWQTLTDEGREIVPPCDELETRLVEIYGRLLGAPTVSVLDNFAQLGGHSLLAVRLLDTCRQELHAEPDARKLLTGTLRDVAESIRAASASHASANLES